MLQVTRQDPGDAVSQRPHPRRPKVNRVGAANHLQLLDNLLHPCHPADGGGEPQDQGDEPSQGFGIGLQVGPSFPQAHKDFKGLVRALVRMVHGNKSRAQRRALPKGHARQHGRTRCDMHALCRHRRRVRLCGRQQNALPGTFPIHGDAFAARVPGLAVNLLDDVSRNIAGQIDGGGDGLINMTLQHGLHEHTFIRINAMGGGEEIGQSRLGIQVMSRPVLHCQGVRHGKLPLGERLTATRIRQIKDRLNTRGTPRQRRNRPRRGNGQQRDVAQPLARQFLQERRGEGSKEGTLLLDSGVLCSKHCSRSTTPF